ncbi:MAG: TetR/AcrR family transcriptional regulator [Patescibacteria group bacterium]
MTDQTEQAEAPGLNRRQAAKVKTRAKVLAAACKLFVEKGYDLTTIRDIAKDPVLDMSTGAIFANFGSKAELFIAVVEMKFRERETEANALAEGNRPIRERIHAISALDYRFYVENMPLAGMLTVSAWQRVPAVARYLTKVKYTLVGTIERLLALAASRNELPQGLNTQLLAEMIWSVHEGNFDLALLGGWDESEMNPRFGQQLAILLPNTGN